MAGSTMLLLFVLLKYIFYHQNKSYSLSLLISTSEILIQIRNLYVFKAFAILTSNFKYIFHVYLMDKNVK